MRFCGNYTIFSLYIYSSEWLKFPYLQQRLFPPILRSRQAVCPLGSPLLHTVLFCFCLNSHFQFMFCHRFFISFLAFFSFFCFSFSLFIWFIQSSPMVLVCSPVLHSQFVVTFYQKLYSNTSFPITLLQSFQTLKVFFCLNLCIS